MHAPLDSKPELYGNGWSFLMMSLSLLLSRPGWSNICMHFSLCEVCSRMPGGTAAAPAVPRWAQPSLPAPRAEGETALEHTWGHCTRQLQDKYKTTTRQPTRQPTRQLQTWCKSSIWQCASERRKNSFFLSFNTNQPNVDFTSCLELSCRLSCSCLVLVL